MGKSIERYLGQVEALLPSDLDETVRRRLVDEAENHLYESAAGYRELGHSEVEAEDLAVEAYGRSREVVGEMALPVSQSFDSKVVHGSMGGLLALDFAFAVISTYRYHFMHYGMPEGVLNSLLNFGILASWVTLGWVGLSAWRVREFQVKKWLTKGWAMGAILFVLALVEIPLSRRSSMYVNVFHVQDSITLFGEQYSLGIVQYLGDMFYLSIRLIGTLSVFSMIRCVSVIYLTRGVRFLWDREIRARTRARQKA